MTLGVSTNKKVAEAFYYAANRGHSADIEQQKLIEELKNHKTWL